MAAKWPEHLACERVEWLPTEASGRRYARLHGPRHVEAPSAVLMVFPKGTPPEEVERVRHATLALAALALPVPEVYDSRAAERWILQEDLGDTTLAQARERGDQVAPYYSEALALLEPIREARLQTSPRPPLDARRLRDELEHFARHALGLEQGPGAGLAAEFDQLVAACAALPVVLCHRDYHSRNLMVHDGRLRVVDHQDALPGPAPYDRVSLAYDPYVELPDEVRDRIAGSDPGRDEIAVQRLVKALGTFADKGGEWTRFLAPASIQARRLLGRSELNLPLLELALRSVELRGGSDAARARAASRGTGTTSAGAPTARGPAGEATV